MSNANRSHSAFSRNMRISGRTPRRGIDFDMSSAEATVRSVPLADVGGPGAKSPAANSARQISGLERPACGAGLLMCCLPSLR